MIATPVVELGGKMPQLIGHLLPGQAQLDPARESAVQRRAVKAADHYIRHRVIVPPEAAESAATVASIGWAHGDRLTAAWTHQSVAVLATLMKPV